MSNLRFGTVVGCLLVIWAICVAIMISPVIRSLDVLRLVSLIFLLAILGTLILGAKSIWKRPHPLNWLVVLLAALAVPFITFAHAFNDFSMFTFLFHVEFGTGDATLAGLGDSIGTAVLVTLFFALSVYWFHSFVGPKRGFWPVVLLVIIVVNPVSQFLVSYAISSASDDILVQELRTPQMIAETPTPDVMVIYLEGIELGFRQRELYGDIFQPLDDLAPQSVSFENVMQTAGTEWSIAGLAATLCGLPLLPNGLSFRNKFTEQDVFLGGHLCLSDVLKDKGYTLRFLKGTDKDFAGFDHFLGTHSFDDVIDRQAQFAMYPQNEIDAASTGWTIDDQMLLKTSRAEYLDLVQDPAPIAMFIETIGPHGTSSVISRECRDVNQALTTTDVAASVDCTLQAVARFMTFIDENRDGRPTVFLLMSDHLNHAPTVGERLPLAGRRNLIMFHGLDYQSPLAQPGDVSDKPASMMDVYPTILAWLGFSAKDVRGGLGVSLFSEAPTLVDQLGLEAFDMQLLPNPALSSAIWGAADP